MLSSHHNLLCRFGRYVSFLTTWIVRAHFYVIWCMQHSNCFLHSIVLFVHIKGFTSWSSSREPVEVFKLLETLYGAFDLIADQRKVFKVETIGDCYVAITGCRKLPTMGKCDAFEVLSFSCLTNQMVPIFP